MFMDDNARPHRARIVQHFLQQEAVQTIPWPPMSPDMNPIEHVWDCIGNARVSKWGTTRAASTLSRYFWPVRKSSRTYKSNLQSKEKQPDSYTPTPKSSCAQNVVVPVDITSSPCSIWLVTWSFGVDYLHMETGPLVWWKSLFATPYRRSCKGLAPTKHFISGQPHFGHNCFWGWGCNCLGLFFLWL
jgi:hypothetical protein